ncbi:MAG: sigma 54-interacting transcriptional regulator [Thermomicrobiales bacterium]
MSSSYDPKDHVQRLVIAPRAEGILEQREITIHSYQSTVPFSFDALDLGLQTAWLTPQIQFGVFSRIISGSRDAVNVVLGLQDELTIRAYDYDERRPIWYSWQNAIVETVSVHYFPDENGLLRFTTTGGGRRITDDLLQRFNSTFFRIPKDAVTKRQFDLEKLRDLCFKRFADRLYMVRFADPSAKEYRSIDHALFQSRQYIDPKAERLREISTDKEVKIESFDSDILVLTDELASEIQVRFFIRGLSGSLRLRFPRVTYKSQLKTPEEQTLVFYRLVDAAVSAILDEDYYARQWRTLDELSEDLGMFPDMVDLEPYREVLTSADARKVFFLHLDLSDQWPKWSPHLQALDELLDSDAIAADVRTLLGELVNRDPSLSVRLLATCQGDAKKHRVGAIVAQLLAQEVQTMPADLRPVAEEALLSWAIECDEESWDVDVRTGEWSALHLTWRIADIAFDILPTVLWKLVGVLHERLKSCTDDIGPLLQKFHWCITAAKGLPEHHSKSPAALRLVSAGKIPRSVEEAKKILKDPVADHCALDDGVLNQFGLPLWPLLSVSHQDGTARLSNDGIGAALKVDVIASNAPAGSNGSPVIVDLRSDDSMPIALPGDLAAVDVRFDKLGRTYRVSLPIGGSSATTISDNSIRSLPLVINQKRVSTQRECRARIDPDGIVVGSSAALLAVFEQIHHANLMDGLPPVLLLGERGVGKTYIAELLHKSSNRALKPFRVVNAGGGGGDLNIQRGEWIGYGKGHGIQGIDANGRPGHLMAVVGGTIFIDEFASLSHDLQVIFLSVLENRRIEKIGGESFAPDVRCIFATNADVEQAVADNTIRRDLLDRIPITISVPALRDRRGDVLLLAKHFAQQRMTDRCMVALLRHNWPGNVRELRNTIGAAVARVKSDERDNVDVEDLGLPQDTVAVVQGMDDDACQRELWTIADAIARAEGYEFGTGLQRRAGEILGVGQPQASKMYKAHGLALEASA